jgi:photosystem II stability/assembly factor-like uncharacterized protein
LTPSRIGYTDAVRFVRFATLAALSLCLAACSSSPAKPKAQATTSTSGAPTTSTTVATTSTTEAGPAGGPVPTGFQAQSVTFVSASEGFVLGVAKCPSGTCPAVLRTRDAGHSWVGIPAPTVKVGTDTGQASQIRFADPADGWIGGHGVLTATHDGGSTWQALSSPGAGTIESLEAGGGYAYALVISGNAANPAPASVYRTPVASDSWSLMPGSTVSGAVSGSLVVQSGSAWEVVQPAGAKSVLRTLIGGQWVSRALPCQGPSGQALAASDTTHLAVVCANGAAAGQQPKLVYTSGDGGQTWAAAGSAPDGGDTLGVAMASKSTIVIAAASGASYLYASFNSGRTWSTVDQDADGGGLPWSDIGFTTALQGVVIEGQVGITGTASRLFVTRDGGHSWTPASFGA